MAASLSPAALAGLQGRAIRPGDADYDEARTVFAGGIERRPGLIARVATAADVARVIALARDTGLPLAVRSGGLKQRAGRWPARSPVAGLPGRRDQRRVRSHAH